MDSSSVSVKSFSKVVDGFRIPGMFLEETYRSALAYKPRNDDVFIVTYPKCGTTWSQHILMLIFSQGEPIKDFFTMMAKSPFLEFSGAEAAEVMSRPGAIKVHLPYHLTPQSDKAKYIYVARNPKDCLVSYFHHMKNIPGHLLEGTFDDFFEMFQSGEIDYGDYYDNLLGWYEHRNDPNVLFITYEEMKADTRSAILKMASFLDDEKYAEPLRNDPKILNNVLHFSSFDHMKQSVNKSMEDLFAMTKEDMLKEGFMKELPEMMRESFIQMAEKTEEAKKEAPKESNFVRKGIVGDWKNHLSEEQSRRMEVKFDERTKGTDIPNLWKNMMYNQ